MDRVKHLKHTDVNCILYRKCQETIEHVFADTKEKYGKRCSGYRGLTIQANDTYFYCLESQKACELVLGVPRESTSLLHFN